MIKVVILCFFLKIIILCIWCNRKNMLTWFNVQKHIFQILYIISKVYIQFFLCFVIDKENVLKKRRTFAVYSLFPSNWPFNDKMVCVMTSYIKNELSHRF